MNKITKYLALSILKSKFILIYGILLNCICFGLFFISNDQDKAVIGINNVLLILIPLVVMIYTVSQIYQSNDFIRLLLTQPIERKSIFISQFLSYTIILSFIQCISIILPFILLSDASLLPTVLLNSLFLTFIFSAISFLIAYSINEKVKGIGVTIFLGIYFLAIYDGLLLLLIQAMSEYPIEKYGIALSLLNPIDLCRILFIFKMDISALMGITGAIMQKIIGSNLGTFVIYSVLIFWACIPLIFAGRKFIRKDY